MASVGNREAIHLLVRDANKLVHMTAVRNPRVNANDARKWSASKSLPDNVIAYICGNREWTRHYDVIRNLVNNPKTPLPNAMTYINHLRTNDLRDLARNRNVPMQVARQAKAMLKKRQH
jgi:hypothetical protein